MSKSKDFPKLKVKFLRIDELKPYANNARKHPPDQVEKIAKSIKSLGFNNPILIDGQKRRNSRSWPFRSRQTAPAWRGVPTIRIDHLTDTQKRAYMIADNRLAEITGWYNEILAIELQDLSTNSLDFDLDAIGFETPEIDLQIQQANHAEDPDDELIEVDVQSPPVSRLGDLWHCGAHRVLNGDARHLDHFKVLMGHDRARMVFTDPPYNVKVRGHVGGLGKTQHSEFVMASGEMAQPEYVLFLQVTLCNHTLFCVDGALYFICMDWRHMREVLEAGRVIFTELKNICIWNKTNGGMGSLYRSKHEFVWIFKKGSAPHVNNVMLGSHGRYPDQRVGLRRGQHFPRRSNG